LVLLVSACSASSASVANDAPLPFADAPGPDAPSRAAPLQGWVALRGGAGDQPVAGATVSIAGGPSATTDASGRYLLSDVPQGSVVLHVAGPPGQPLSTTALALPAGAKSAAAYLLNGCSAQVSASTGDTVDVAKCGDGGPTRIVFPPGAFVTAAGAPFGGTARVDM